MKKLVLALVLGSFVGAFAQSKQVTLDFTGPVNPGQSGVPIQTYYQQSDTITFGSNAMVWNTITYNPTFKPINYFSYVDPNDFNCATSNQTTCLSLKKPFSNNIVLQGRAGGAQNILMNIQLGISGFLSLQTGGSLRGSQVRIYSGLNGTGKLLTTMYIPASGSPDRGCQMCKWSNEIALDPTLRVAWTGIAHSVVFDQGPGGAGYIEYDNVTFILQ